MTVAFESVQRSAALFAESLLGRPIRFELDDGQSPSGRRSLGFRIDDYAIVLPPAIDVFADHEHNRRAFRQAVLHQAACDLFGTVAFGVNDFLAEHPDRPLLATTFDAIEACRLDAVVTARFPGATSDVQRAQALADVDLDPRLAMIVQRVRATAGLGQWTTEDAASLALAMCPPVALLELEFESSPDAAQITVVADESAGDQPSGDGDDFGPLDAMLQHALGEIAALNDLDAVTDADHTEASGDLPEEAPPRPAAQGARPVAASQSKPTVHVGSTPTSGRSYLYDEWDMHSEQYLRRVVPGQRTPPDRWRPGVHHRCAPAVRRVGSIDPATFSPNRC